MKIGKEARFCSRILHSLKILCCRVVRVKFHIAVSKQSKILKLRLPKRGKISREVVRRGRIYLSGNVTKNFINPRSRRYPSRSSIVLVKLLAKATLHSKVIIVKVASVL